MASVCEVFLSWNTSKLFRSMTVQTMRDTKGADNSSLSQISAGQSNIAENVETFRDTSSGETLSPDEVQQLRRLLNKLDTSSAASFNYVQSGCDVIVNKDKGVSRIHAEILIDEMISLDHSLKKPSNILSKVRIKDSSKYGTFLNKDLDSKEKVHEFPNKETMLKDGDLVSFGTGNATYRLSYVSFIFFICSPKHSKTNQLITKKVSSIGATITKKWSLDCSHVLVDDSFPLTQDLIDAIVARKPLVQYSWVEVAVVKWLADCGEWFLTGLG